MKTCNRCNIEKEDSEFGCQKRFSKRYNEIRYYKNFACKLCMREVSAKNRIKHTDDYKGKIKEYGKRYYAKKPKVKLSQDKLAVNREYSQVISNKLTPVHIKGAILRNFRKKGITDISIKDIPAIMVEIKTKQLTTWRTAKRLRT